MKDYFFRENYPTFEEFAKATNTVYYCTVRSEELDEILDGNGLLYSELICGGIEKADLSVKKAIWDAVLENGVQIYCTDILHHNPEFDLISSLLFTPDDDIELGSIHRSGDYIFTTEFDIISDNLSW